MAITTGRTLWASLEILRTSYAPCVTETPPPPPHTHHQPPVPPTLSPSPTPNSPLYRHGPWETCVCQPVCTVSSLMHRAVNNTASIQDGKHTRASARTHARTHAHMHACTRARTHTHTHTQKKNTHTQNTHTHTHLHIQKTRYKKLVTHVEPQASAVSLLKRAENSAI